MNIVDCHAHVGWFSDGYHSPIEIWNAEKSAGVNEIVVSSTSTCAEKYKLVIKEMIELKKLGGNNVHPLLWLTPKMFQGHCRWALPYMLNSKIKWEGIKMHWMSHTSWYYQHHLLDKALSLVKKLNVPLLLHTGETKETMPLNFLPICRDNPDISVVLAHGRPPLETCKILEICENVMVDTSFMTAENIDFYVKRNFVDRLCFGTDIPINKVYWSEDNTTNYIERKLKELRTIVSEEQFSEIIQRNPYNSP